MVVHVALGFIIWYELMAWERLCASMAIQLVHLSDLACFWPLEECQWTSFSFLSVYKREKSCDVNAI